MRAREKDDQAWWNAEETGVYATGASAAVETTGLAVQALLKWGGAAGDRGEGAQLHRVEEGRVRRVGHHAGHHHGAAGAAAFRRERARRMFAERVEITLNGNPVERLTLTPENNDLLHQFALKDVDASGANTVEVRFDGKGGLAYQVVGRYFVPWNEKPANEPLSISVDLRPHAAGAGRYRDGHGDHQEQPGQDREHGDGGPWDSSRLRPAERRPAGVTRRRRAGRKGGRLEKFSLTATQAILYFDSVAGGETVELRFRLRAKISDPRADVPVASLRILRPGGGIGGAAGAIGGAEEVAAIGRSR